MLKGSCLPAVGLVAAALPAAAYGQTGPGGGKSSGTRGMCWVEATDPGRLGSPVGGAPQRGNGPAQQAGGHISGRPQFACVDQPWTPPPAGDPLWGGHSPSEGSLKLLICQGGGALQGWPRVVFAPNGQPVALPQVSPAELAEQAISAMELSAPDIRLAPRRTPRTVRRSAARARGRLGCGAGDAVPAEQPGQRGSRDQQWPARRAARGRCGADPARTAGRRRRRSPAPRADRAACRQRARGCGRTRPPVCRAAMRSGAFGCGRCVRRTAAGESTDAATESGACRRLDALKSASAGLAWHCGRSRGAEAPEVYLLSRWTSTFSGSNYPSELLKLAR